MLTGELHQQVLDFRQRLRDAGLTKVNATGELGNGEVTVTTQYAHSEWTVAVRPATGATETRTDIIRVRLNESATADINRDKLIDVGSALRQWGVNL